MAKEPFSPLFIGEDSSTASPDVLGASFPTFSPLFIGEDSSTYGYGAARSEGTPFSPLFIGEDSSTWKKDDATLVPKAFQSPLHRGRLFNCCTWAPSCSLCPSFSPLFIGEDSSTGDITASHADEIVLSVPSSSGKTLQRAISAKPCLSTWPFQSPLHR